MGLFGTIYQDANIDYYWEVIKNWSDSNDNKKIDWLAAAKIWMGKDMVAGKFIQNNHQIPENGKTIILNGRSKSGTGAKQQAAAENW